MGATTVEDTLVGEEIFIHRRKKADKSFKFPKNHLYLQYL